MDGFDLTQAALDALQPAKAKATAATDLDEARRIRGRLLGALIRKRRLEAERSAAECAQFMDAPPELIEAWEVGESAPSLPQLELLSQFLNGQGADPAQNEGPENRAARAEYVLLRRRLIGAMLRAARQSGGKRVEALSEAAGLEAAALENLELGEEALPLSDLVALTQALSADLNVFAAPASHMPNTTESDALATGGHPRADWRQFAAAGENLPFIRLAMAFQHIARDDLHRIADALFAIIRASGESNGWSGPPS